MIFVLFLLEATVAFFFITLQVEIATLTLDSFLFASIRVRWKSVKKEWNTWHWKCQRVPRALECENENSDGQICEGVCQLQDELWHSSFAALFTEEYYRVKSKWTRVRAISSITVSSICKYAVLRFSIYIGRFLRQNLEKLKNYVSNRFLWSEILRFKHVCALIFVLRSQNGVHRILTL